MPFAPVAPSEPGIVIEFPSFVEHRRNFFGWPLGGGDSSYDSTRFATKIRSVGVWFSNYDNTELSETPRVYLVPAGMDILRAPGANGATRRWQVLDQVLPVPFPLSAVDLEDPGWIPAHDSLSATFSEIRKFGTLRAYHDGGTYRQDEMNMDTRLIGRSVWNTRWVLIIPGSALHADAWEGLSRFVDGVTDIKLFFQTYSYAADSMAAE
jgi:hypothetical protein